MSLSDLDAIGSFVGGVAVVVSFGFLALHLRQAARSTASSAMGAWLGDYNSMLLGITHDADSAVLVRRGLSDFAGLSPNDQMRFHTFMTQIMLSSIYLFDQRGEGAFDHEIGEQVLGFHSAMFKTPGGKHWWESMEPVLGPDFRAHMDDRIRNAPPITEALPWFQADAA